MSGFTKIDNTILEEMARRKFNGTQYRILFAVWRYTFGFQRNQHELSLNFIAEATGIERSRVKKDLNKLIECNVITVVQEASFNSTRIIAFNNNFIEWKIDHCESIRPQGANPTTGDENNYTPGGEIDHTPGGESDPQERKIKEISKEKDDGMDKPNPFREYEIHFGVLPGGIFLSQINDWIDNSQFKEPEAIICEVIKKAKLHTPNNPPKYIQSILKSLHNLELYTLQDVRNYNANFEKKTRKQSTPKLALVRPDHWEEPKPLTKEEQAEIEAMEDEFPF